MLELAQNFEQAAKNFQPVFLILPGVVAVVLGLFVWLGGLGLRRALAALVAAIATGLACFLFVQQNLLIALAAAGIAAILAGFFARVIMVLVAAILIAVVAFFFIAKPYMYARHGNILEAAPQIEQRTMDIKQTAETIKTYAHRFANELQQARYEMPVYRQVLILALAVMALVAGFYFWRLISSFSCALVGTSLIFAGMILLLLFKGSLPITHIIRNQAYYGIVFVAMVAFGTIEQMILSRFWLAREAAKSKSRKGKGKDSESGDEERRPHWRGS
jgi:hypothetical protein